MRASASSQPPAHLPTGLQTRPLPRHDGGKRLRARLQSSVVLTLLGFVFGTILWFTLQPFPEAEPAPPETTGSMLLSWE